MIRVSKTNTQIEREPLISPFRFKGGSLTELWQTVVKLETDNGYSGIGVGVQSVLWSEPYIFENYGESEGNQMMFDITKRALQAAEGAQFSTPFELLKHVLPLVTNYARERTDHLKLKQTFVLNALTAFDHAAWSLYAKKQDETAFSKLVPAAYEDAIQYRNQILASVPLVSYGMSEQEIAQLIEQGYDVLKIRLGANPDDDNDLDKMLAADKERLFTVHQVAKDARSPHTTSGKIAYYLDCNERYDSKERLLKLLDYADEIGALERVVILEEPYPQELKLSVSDLPVTVAADESVHGVDDAMERIELGYKAFALKPIAKTMSLSLEIAKIAYEHGIACYCADLTVNPLMVDWNKCLAAHLKPIPGMNIGMMESNGAQNYLNWEQMKTAHPIANATWSQLKEGNYHLDESFYASSGGTLDTSLHYAALVEEGLE